MDTLEKNKRVKILNIPRNMLFAMLQRKNMESATFFADLPEGFEVLSINGNWRSGTVEAMIHHPSFDKIANGMEPPLINALMEDIQFAKILPTCMLVDELKSREGVDEIEILPHQPYMIETVQPNGKDDKDKCRESNGPARILVVTD